MLNAHFRVSEYSRLDCSYCWNISSSIAVCIDTVRVRGKWERTDSSCGESEGEEGVREPIVLVVRVRGKRE